MWFVLFLVFLVIYPPIAYFILIIGIAFMVLAK